MRSLIYKLANKLHPHLAGELQERFRREQGNEETARIFATLAQAKKQQREVWTDRVGGGFQQSRIDVGD